MYKRVAVIGGGAAGAALVSELLERQFESSIHVDWFTGGHGGLARGVAYGTTSHRHLLNVRAASMSLFAGKPRGFLDYAQGLDDTTGGADFLPRRLYGDYLQTEVENAMARARTRGHIVHVLPVAVDAMTPTADGVDIVAGDQHSRVDAAVLAIGSLPPRPVPGVADGALASGQYITDPWPFLAEAHDDDAQKRVLVIGMGLTAVDVILELSQRWPNAHFTAVSRHGLPPEAHPVAASAPADGGDDLVESLFDLPNARAWVRQLREATEQADDWRPVIDALRPHLPALWQALPNGERARFLRHARWAWERVRHRMPPQVADALQVLEVEGRLIRKRGRLRSVDVAGDHLAVTLLSHIDHVDHAENYDIVIQTIGLNTDVKRSNHLLLGQLVTDGYVRADTLGLGLDAEPDGQLQNGHGEAWPRLFAMGTLLRSVLWESTAMPEIRQQARALADRLIGKHG